MTVQAHPRKLTPLQEDTVRALRRQGVPIRVLADTYGVTKRTIQRTLHERAPLRIEVVVLDGWYAQFEIHELGPVQRTDWRAVA